MIDKNNPMPLYSQLQEIMLDKIKKGVYPIEKALPSEFELVTNYGVSRTTVRQAIENLVKEGYLEKRRGVGTFVIEKKEKNLWDLQSLKSFRDIFIDRGYSVKTKLLQIKYIETNEELKNIFGKNIQNFYCLERVRYLNEKPAVCVTTYVPANIARDLDKYDFSRESLFDILSNIYDVKIGYATKEFKAIPVSQKDALLLDIKNNSPIQFVKTITYTTQDIPIEYSLSRDRGDLSIYKIKINYRR